MFLLVVVCPRILSPRAKIRFDLHEGWHILYHTNARTERLGQVYRTQMLSNGVDKGESKGL